MKPFVEEIDIEAEEAALALHHLPYTLWLDSSDVAHPNGRYSFLMAFPVEMIEAKDGKVTITNAAQQTVLYHDIFKILKERLTAWKNEFEPVEGLPPFQGGLAGFFGYDLARLMERLPENARNNPYMPDLAMGIYDQVMAFDHLDGKAWIITYAASERDAKLKRARIMAIINTHHNSLKENPAVRWAPQDEAEDYKNKVQRVIDYIHEGDIFQANLSQRFEAMLPPGFDSFSHYMHMREINPAPFGTYMNLGGAVIASASPEQFLQVQGREVTTRPIKGTRPRSRDRAIDEQNKTELQNSEKDMAENIMIVDLLRNDLSKVCEANSIEVAELCVTESFAGVHHLVSTINGRLQETPIDLMKACFPGGSITGAPKIRAMEILDEMEPYRRGPYCGSVAYIGFDGNMDSNILIRTLVYQGNKVSLQAGGGITADSDSEAEYQETLTKAEKIFRSFEQTKRQVKRA